MTIKTCHYSQLWYILSSSIPVKGFVTCACSDPIRISAFFYFAVVIPPFFYPYTGSSDSYRSFLKIKYIGIPLYLLYHGIPIMTIYYCLFLILFEKIQLGHIVLNPIDCFRVVLGICFKTDKVTFCI
mgnify:CR=1 FL=1